jgi:hypothetical protein
LDQKRNLLGKGWTKNALLEKVQQKFNALLSAKQVEKVQQKSTFRKSAAKKHF